MHVRARIEAGNDREIDGGNLGGEIGGSVSVLCW